MTKNGGVPESRPAIAASTLVVGGELVEAHVGGSPLHLAGVAAGDRVAGPDPLVRPDLTVIDDDGAVGCRARKNQVAKRRGEAWAGVQCANHTNASAVDREARLLERFAHRGGAGRLQHRLGVGVGVGGPDAPGEVLASMRPPGNTQAPPAKARRESRFSIRVSRPDSAVAYEHDRRRRDGGIPSRPEGSLSIGRTLQEGTDPGCGADSS